MFQSESGSLEKYFFQLLRTNGIIIHLIYVGDCIYDEELLGEALHDFLSVNPKSL